MTPFQQLQTWFHNRADLQQNIPSGRPMWRRPTRVNGFRCHRVTDGRFTASSR